MSGYISRLSIVSILVSALTMIGCSSSDSGGIPSASVPANAIVITEANAKDTVVMAVSLGNSLIDVAVPSAIDIVQAPTTRDIINLVIDKAKHPNGSSLLSTPTGVAITEPCDNEGGTVTYDEVSTETSSSGTVSFNNCLISGITLNGSLTFNFTWSLDTGAYTDSIQGSFSGTYGGETFSLNGLDFRASGNELTGDYTINTYTYSVDSSVGGGFLVQLQAPIVGKDDSNICPSSGIVMVTGANNTQAKATINNDDTVTVEFNDGSGTFTEVPDSPFLCSEILI